MIRLAKAGGIGETPAAMGDLPDLPTDTRAIVPLFDGTRVPVESLFNRLKAGDSIEDFLEDNPGVKRSQVHDVLDAAKSFLLGLH